MAKELTELFWVEELLPEGATRKHMFGGFSYYVDEKLVLVLFEDSSTNTYRGTRYPFAIWNGCMFPAEKEHHAVLFQKYPFLVSHPVLPKWLYLPLETEDFEHNVRTLLRELRRLNPLLGTIPKSKKAASPKKASNKSKTQIDEKIDTRHPRMFSEESSEAAFEKAKKLSDLKNLGPESEKALLKAGIKTTAQMKKLGWQKTMIQLCKADPRNNHAVFAYAIIGAFQNKLWNLISNDEKKEARQLMKDVRAKAAKKQKKSKVKKRNSFLSS